METKLNSGALFKNDKGGNEKRPDYKGTFTDGQGVEHWLSAWVKKDKNGNSYMSISAQVKDKSVASPAVSVTSSDQSQDDLPF